MSISLADSIIRFLGGLFAFVTLGIVFYGIWRGTRRPMGRAAGHAAAWLHSAWFYLLVSVLYCAGAYLGWIPLPLTLSPSLRAWMLAMGALLYFPGVTLVLWGRLTLGKNYFVSTGFGAQLFKEHHLITSGPFAVMRHPMYVGLVLAAFGGLLIYATWTTLVFACLAPLVLVRAWREEQALAAEFGEQWQEYCKRVPAFFPRWRKVKTTHKHR